MEATYGSRDRFDMRGTVDIPLTSNLSSQVSFSRKYQKGYQRIIPFPGDTGVTGEYNLSIIPQNTSNRRGGTDTYTFPRQAEVGANRSDYRPSDG